MKNRPWLRVFVFYICLVLVGIGYYCWNQRLLLPPDQKLAEVFGDSREILERPDRVILYSLDYRNGSWPNGATTFEQSDTLGKVDITEPARRQWLKQIIYDGIARSGKMLKCAELTYAVRIIKGNQSLDIAMNFDCHMMSVYVDGQLRGDLYMNFNSFHRRQIDQILKKAGIPVL